jgi:hypothetical protein
LDLTVIGLCARPNHQRIFYAQPDDQEYQAPSIIAVLSAVQTPPISLAPLSLLYLSLQQIVLSRRMSMRTVVIRKIQLK